MYLVANAAKPVIAELVHIQLQETGKPLDCVGLVRYVATKKKHDKNS